MDDETRTGPTAEDVRHAVLEKYLTDRDDIDEEMLAADLVATVKARKPRMRPDKSQGRALPLGHGRTPEQVFADWWRRTNGHHIY